MEWLTEKLLWLWNNPEVTWSGAGITGLGVLYFLTTKLFAPRIRKESIPAVNTSSSTTQTVSGSGAAAQDGSTAAGAGGVAVGGNVHGDIYVNTKQPGSS